MPTYEYECSACGGHFEQFQSMKDDPLTDCILEGCGAKGSVKRLIGAGAGLIFKGSGFYITDYKNGKPSAASGSPASKSESSSESKSETKSESKADSKPASPSSSCSGGSCSSGD